MCSFAAWTNSTVLHKRVLFFALLQSFDASISNTLNVSMQFGKKIRPSENYSKTRFPATTSILFTALLLPVREKKIWKIWSQFAVFFLFFFTNRTDTWADRFQTEVTGRHEWGQSVCRLRLKHLSVVSFLPFSRARVLPGVGLVSGASRSYALIRADWK